MSVSLNSSTINTIGLTNTNIGIGSSNDIWSTNARHSSIHAQGDVIVDGDLIVKGKSHVLTIDERLTAIEERLAILRPDKELESRWDELKQAREHYMRLEAEFRSYERVIDILKT
jgi:hypothetical protein